MSTDSNIYLAYPDRVLTYDCRRCPVLCCKGAGVAFSVDEVEAFPDGGETLADRARTLAGPYVFFDMSGCGCPWLDGRNRCRIESEAGTRGKAAKPLLCRLFPLSLSVRVGRWVALRPHFSSCPMRLVLPPRRGLNGSHKAALDALGTADWTPICRLEAALPDGVTDSEVVARESTFRDRCASLLSSGGAWNELGTSGSRGEAAGILSLLGIPAAAEGRLRACESAAAEGGLWSDLLLAAVAPSLRLDLLSLPGERIDVALELARFLGHGPQASIFPGVGPVRRPAKRERCRMDESVAGRRGGRAGGHSRRSGRELSGVSDLFGMLHGLSPAVALVAWGSLPCPGLSEGAALPAFGQLRMKLAGAVLLRDLRAGMGVVPALRRAMEDSFSAPEKVAFLVQMGLALGTTPHGQGTARSNASRLQA
ncbi:MAG: YkgJ family cysteine cluster protein [Deltaproteobacteria bacterium]|nr:YkgJ family cysteine cluster protein [Deltaproteobacteria bacterium]